MLCPNTELYAASWHYELPCYVLDSARGLFWEICLDLEAVAQSCGNDNVALLDFLMRRTDCKPLVLKWMHKLLVHQTRLVAMARIFLTLNQTLYESLQKPEPEPVKKSRWSLFGDSEVLEELSVTSPFESMLIARKTHLSGPPSFSENSDATLDRYVNDRIVIDQDRDIFKCVFAM